MNSNVLSVSLSGKSQKGWSLLETLAAIVIVGIGIALFARIQNMTSKGNIRNSDLLKAGHLIEADIDSLRLYIARDTTNNWNTFITSASPYLRTVGRISVSRTRGDAVSPKDGAAIPNVKSIAYVASWGTAVLDTIRVTTYVAKRF